MRNHHEDQEMFDVRNYFYVLCHHARFMECLQRKPRQHKGGLTAHQHKEVAEKLAQEVFGTADGLGKNERIDAGAEISDYRVRHEQGRKQRQGHERVHGERAGDEKVTVDGPAPPGRRSPSPPKQSIAAAQQSHEIWRDALGIEQHFVPEDGAEHCACGASHPNFLR